MTMIKWYKYTILNVYKLTNINHAIEMINEAKRENT